MWNQEYPGAFSMWMALTQVSPANGGLYAYQAPTPTGSSSTPMTRTIPGTRV
ncbi:hypothetical protein [Nocardiopsis sp. CNR-923]|uniref:hypothetical protein n=1 Tax=Nocardiopsis sp. CNR-923 TaxID=1904965 RepID=UPI00373FCFC9